MKFILFSKKTTLHIKLYWHPAVKCKRQLLLSLPAMHLIKEVCDMKNLCLCIQKHHFVFWFMYTQVLNKQKRRQDHIHTLTHTHTHTHTHTRTHTNPSAVNKTMSISINIIFKVLENVIFDCVRSTINLALSLFMYSLLRSTFS